MLDEGYGKSTAQWCRTCRCHVSGPKPLPGVGQSGFKSVACPWVTELLSPVQARYSRADSAGKFPEPA